MQVVLLYRYLRPNRRKRKELLTTVTEYLRTF